MYRVTAHAVPNLPLTPKQRLRFSTYMGLVLKRNFCCDVNRNNMNGHPVYVPFFHSRRLSAGFFAANVVAAIVEATGLNNQSS